VTQRGIGWAGAGEPSPVAASTPADAAPRLCRPILHCTKFDFIRVGANPNAKKYRSAVSFRVVAGAFDGYFLLYKIKSGGARIGTIQSAGRLMEADSGT